MEKLETPLADLLEENILPVIHSAFASMFSAADQAILVLAAKGSSNKEQNRYYEAAQNLRIVRFELLEYFNCLMLGQQLPEGVKASQEHIDSLAKLVSVRPHEYQADAALAASVLDCNKRLVELGARYANPLVPDQFVEHFLVSLSLVSLDVHTKMLLIRMFERHLYSQLTSYIAKLNDVLVERDILPELHTQPGELAYSVNALVDKALDKAQFGSDNEEVSASIAGVALSSVLDELQAEDVEKLFEVLDADNTADAWQPFMLQRDILQELKAAGLPDELNTAEQMQLDKIPLVADLFSSFQSNIALPAMAKAMFQALIVPFTRIALSSSDFFIKDNHPARLLLREMLALCENWEPKFAHLEQDNLYLLLLKIVQAFIETERLESIDYQSLQFDLLAYREALRQKQEASGQRLADSAYSAQIGERARDDVGKVVSQKLENKRLPFAAYKFIQEAWGHVLYVHAMNTGVNSKSWMSAVSTLDALLDTFQPAQTYPSRAELLVQLPSLLRALREGLVSIGMEKARINQWFSELEEAHKTLAVSIGGELGDNPLELLETANAKIQSDKFIEEPSDSSQEDEVEDERYLTLLDNISQGVWFNWSRPEGIVRCQLAAIIKHADKYIIVDRSGAKLTELLKRELVKKLQTQEMEVVQSGVMFDKTLASIIDDIRGGR